MSKQIILIYNYLCSTIRSTNDLKDKKLDLMIFLNNQARAKGFLYLCDGISTSID